VKRFILWIILNSIFLAIFNTFFFLLGGSEHNVTVWISYGFIHFAYFMLVITPFITRKSKRTAVLGLSIYSISVGYFIVQLVIGVILILIAPEDYKATLLIQLTIAGLYGIILVLTLIANEHTADAEKIRQYEIAYVKDASAKLKSVLDNIKEKDIKKKVEKVYDAIYSSPVKSHPSLAQLENNILNSIDELKDALLEKNNDKTTSLSETLLSAINERNQRLKNLN
jgi:Na+/melibiose symporter-like transporter